MTRTKMIDVDESVICRNSNNVVHRHTFKDAAPFSTLPNPKRQKRRRVSMLFCILLVLIVMTSILTVSFNMTDDFPLLYGKIPGKGKSFPWNDTLDGSDFVLCPERSISCFDPGLNGDFGLRTGKLRRELHKRFSTLYGCFPDPIIRQMRNWRTKPTVGDLNSVIRSESIEVEPTAKRPYRLAILFLVVDQLSHTKVWTDWFSAAKKWSYEMYEKSESGPFSGLSEDARRSMRDEDIYLLSVKTHYVAASVHNTRGAAQNEIPITDALPSELLHTLVPQVQSKWGALTGVQYQLLKYALEDPHNFGFIFASDSTVPVKPFSFIYEEFSKNPRSRFFFNNVNLPLIRKHDQWVVLNRAHAVSLVQTPELWTCANWLIQPYSRWKSDKIWAASDEHLLFYALSERIGISSIWDQINEGEVNRFPVFNWKTSTPRKYHGIRHTWVCWATRERDLDNCGRIGQFTSKVHSPVTFVSVVSSEFERTLLNDRNVWFARKFSPNCTVDISEEELSKIFNLKLVDHPNSHKRDMLLSFGVWLSYKLNSLQYSDIFEH